MSENEVWTSYIAISQQFQTIQYLDSPATEVAHQLGYKSNSAQMSVVRKAQVALQMVQLQ